MPVFAEDVDEDLDEADDEDIDDAFGEARKRAKGRGYNKPRIEKSFATQAQLEALSQRVGKDIRTIDTNVKALEKTTRRGASSVNQSIQMMALLPLLTRKTATVTGTGSLPSGTKVVIDDGDALTLLLPMFMLGGMGGGYNGNGTAQQQNGTMDPMMMMMMVLAISGGLSSKGTSS